MAQQNSGKLVAGVREVHDGMLYDIDTAVQIASDRFWDGRNWERNGRNTYLFKTSNGRFFLRHITQWQSEGNYLEPINLDDAKRYFESLPERYESWEEAFGEELPKA